MSLEKIIRPYQFREITPPRPPGTGKISSTGTETNIMVDFGKSFQLKTMNGSESVTVTFYMERWVKEQRNR